jgi:hypothetical protein
MLYPTPMKPLFAALAAAVAVTPFPAPKLTGVTPDTKCDWGPVVEVRSGTVVITTGAGPFELMTGGGVRVAAADGRPLGSVADLKPGQNVRAYYLVDVKRGASAVEIDVVPEPPPSK